MSGPARTRELRSPESAATESPRDLPPGQALVAPGRWPLMGERSSRSGNDPWRVAVAGLVAEPREWSLQELQGLPRVEPVVDVHCVTRWSRPGVRFGGVALGTLLDAARPLPTARFVSFTARTEAAHHTSLTLGDALELGTLVALTCEGAPLAPEHGGPVRTVVPGRYFYKSLKWLERIELLAEDRLGTWESGAGYHNRADPWREERYIASNLDRRRVAGLMERRDFSGQELLGLAAADRELPGLQAVRAGLRNADFRRARLAGAAFDGAALANAHFQGADLRGASFRGADLEGADLRGADLRSADLSGASLLGATFGPEAGGDDPWGPARLDAATRLDPSELERLTPVQRRLLEGMKERDGRSG